MSLLPLHLLHLTGVKFTIYKIYKCIYTSVMYPGGMKPDDINNSRVIILE